jgi:hypothetical protein
MIFEKLMNINIELCRLVWRSRRRRGDGTQRSFLRTANAILTQNMREVHSLCDEAGDVATASLLENWIDESEKRLWFLFECGRHA